MVHQEELKQRVFNEETGVREPSRDVEVLEDKQQQNTVATTEPERTQGGSGITRTWRGGAMEEGTSPFSIDDGAGGRSAVRQDGSGAGTPGLSLPSMPSSEVPFLTECGCPGGAVCSRKPPRAQSKTEESGEGAWRREEGNRK